MPTIQHTRLKPKFISIVAIVSLGFVSGAISGTMAQTNALNNNANNNNITPPPAKIAHLQNYKIKSLIISIIQRIQLPTIQAILPMSSTL